MLNIVATSFDDEIRAGAVGTASPQGLQQLQGRARALRIDPELRRVASVDFVQGNAFRSAPAAARGGGVCVNISTARKLPFSHMADYFWSTFRYVHDSPQLCVSMDSTTIDGEDTMTLAWWSPLTSTGGWLVPQVFRG